MFAPSPIELHVFLVCKLCDNSWQKSNRAETGGNSYFPLRRSLSLVHYDTVMSRDIRIPYLDEQYNALRAN